MNLRYLPTTVAVDSDEYYKGVAKQFGDSFLSQNQLDALVIAKYQCHKTGENTQKEETVQGD